MSIPISILFKDEAAMAKLQGLEKAILNPGLTAGAQAIIDEVVGAVQAAAPGSDYPSTLTGNLTGSGSHVTVNVTGPQPLSDWIIKGTSPHDISPVSAGALYWPGADHPVRLVHHPGTQPNNFPQTALDGVLTPVMAALVSHVLEALNAA